MLSSSKNDSEAHESSPFESYVIFSIFKAIHFWEIFIFGVGYSLRDLFMCLRVFRSHSQKNLLPALLSLSLSLSLSLLCVFSEAHKGRFPLPAQCQIHPVRSRNSSSSDGESGLCQLLSSRHLQSLVSFQRSQS